MVRIRELDGLAIDTDAKVPAITLAGLRLPRSFEYSMAGVGGAFGEGGFDVRVTIEFQSGRFECTGLDVRQREGGPTVTSEAIRTLTIKGYVRGALGLLLTNEGAAGEWGFIERQPGLISLDDGATDDVLRWVAQVYTLAYVVNDPPTKTVQDRLGISRATAGRWVAEARRRGILEELRSEDG